MTALLICLTGLRLEAERYLSVDSARKLCFPSSQFEAANVRMTAAETESVEGRTGKRVATARPPRFWIAREGAQVTGLFVTDQALGKHELIDYAVALSPEGRVLRIEILEYRESHGSEIRGAKWRRQFNGKTAGSPLKLNADIYNISGATVSCRSVTEGVRRLLAVFDVVVRPRLSGADRVQPAEVSTTP